MLFNEIGEGGINQGLVKRLGMQVSTAAPTLSPELGAVLVLENDRMEGRQPRNEFTFGVGANVGAVVGENAHITLQNPAAQRNIIVVEAVYGSVASRISVTQIAPPIGGALAAQPLDTRSTGSAAGPYSGTTPTPPPRAFQAPAAATQILEYVITPGWCFVISAEQSNTAATLAVRWRERPAVPGELG